jgi:cell division protein FtsI/penicillin-binding protein 2
MKLKLLLLPALLLTGCVSPFFSKKSAGYPKNQQIQEIVDNEVKAAKESLHPKGLCVVVAEPSTGKILALSAWRKDYCLPEFRSNPGWNAWLLFEPGSTFKPVVVTAALEKGVITPKTEIYCEKGLFYYGGKTIKDHNAAGDMTYDEILMKSSNIGAAKISLKLKDDDYYNYVRRFGFGEKTGISMPSEVAGIAQPPSKWDHLTKTRMAFGQSIAVTPIQLTMAYCALANGGKLMRPLIGEEKPVVVRRVCSAGTALKVKNALTKTVSMEGTAPLARVEGVTVAGKTGTAQAVGKNGTYLPDQFWTIFAGFFPADHPKYVITVVVDEASLPPEKNYGGLVAAPIFADIAGKISKLK